MHLPHHLILVRHGESEGNVVHRRSREEADHSDYTLAFRMRHGSSYRLTRLGIEQAQAAGAWLEQAGLADFDQAFVSEYARAIETAAHLHLPNTRWTTNHALRERDVGLMDQLPENERKQIFPDHVRQAEITPFFWTPPDGESIADVETRLRAGFLPELERNASAKRIIAVTHGRTIQALRTMFEHIPFWLYEERERTGDPTHTIHNAHILQYSRIDPENPGHIIEYFGWMRSICPWDLARTDPAWQRIERPAFTNQQLLAIAERFPHLLP